MHIVIINRWSDEFAAYDRYINHAQHRVSYISSAASREGLEKHCQSARGVVHEVENLSDVETLATTVRALSAVHGPVDRLLALSEFDLIAAAAVRTRFSIPGVQNDRILGFKDKVVMKQKVAAAGLKVPRFCDQSTRHDILAFARTVGSPLIVKPRQGAASQGVLLLSKPSELPDVIAGLDIDSYEVEEYVSGPILHIDGLQQRGCSRFRRVSRYVNTCLGFSQGQPLGSVMVDSPAWLSQVEPFTDAVLHALGLSDSAYHLEIILADGKEPTFLEIGARVGGGEIPFVIWDLYHIDLVHEWIKIELGDRTGDGVIDASQELGGFLMIPEPCHTPCKVTRRTSLVGTTPTLYHEILPSVGDVLDGNGGYDKISGRFRFRGYTSQAIEHDIRAAMAAYCIEFEPLVGGDACHGS